MSDPIVIMGVIIATLLLADIFLFKN